MSNQNQILRKDLRTKRRKISMLEQKHSENFTLQRLIKNPKFKTAHNIGIYLHSFGELHTGKMIEYCFKHHKNVYLPLICNMNKTLRWVKISHQQYRNKRFVLHKLGMLQPMASRASHVSHLDVLLMPLLACDAVGIRMGMGGGFYDRTLASAPFKPYRLGLAHDFQFLQQRLQKNPWDQPLHALITPTKFVRFQCQISQ
ncbi:MULTISPECIES: 5-formyltetrahydrofolate cyclo-ligase [Acinetobacter]|uniref:5-formyltetrahydrofolate cyclo-ligase n=1 Tax=Acinetobacter TaxID=469 RepID=UPI0010208A35|nr:MULTISPECIES: 5-formyltetrahydrofolate cyclo-ligase [Acinetobacter]MDM1758549.1 5-formyltetrahydrofolate cyclo-ligase [Acinetobacter sp. 256-1]MDM1761974.1 5-formyltetrahydrofolate cyclo-ligase [Acinetobacter sp. 251-1]RYL25211.1 5-formyltetrahydrofolate cyclo-ligase [Acinetobacter piscicola]